MPKNAGDITADDATNRALAHGIFRLTLGINICLHGVQRFPHLAGFAAGVVKQFDGVLPQALVAPYALSLPFVEAIIGALLIVGVVQRWALAGGALYMASLTFGTALRGEHEILAEQLGYELSYFALLATFSWDRYSLDALMLRRNHHST